MESKRHENPTLDCTITSYLDLDHGQLFGHSALWDEHTWPQYSIVEASSHLHPYTGYAEEQNVPCIDQYYNTGYEHGDPKQCHFQETLDLLSITPLATFISSPGSLPSSSSSTPFSLPEELECSLDIEMQTKCTTPLDFQERFSPFPASPANSFFDWGAQSPTSGFGPAYSPEITNWSSLPPGVVVSTLSVSPPTSDTIPDISVAQEPFSRSPSLSPSTSSASLPSSMNLNSPAESRTINQLPFTYDLKLAASPGSFRSPSPSPLFVGSTPLRKSARLASRAAENTSHSETGERHSASNPTRNVSLKRSVDRAFSPDDNCDSPNFELDGDYTDNEGEDPHEAIVRQCTLRAKKSKKRHPKREGSRKRCSKCSETFTRSADRMRHLAAVHGINPRSKNEGRCRGCSKYLSRKDSRQRHERKCADFSRLMITSELESN